MLIGDKGIKIKDLFCLCLESVLLQRKLSRCGLCEMFSYSSNLWPYDNAVDINLPVSMQLWACVWGHAQWREGPSLFPSLWFPDSGRSCSTCPMRTARSKRIIPDQTLNIWYPQAGWFGITSVQQCLLWRRQTVLLLVHEDIHYKRVFRDHFW